AANFYRTIGYKYHPIALAETHVDADGVHEQIGKLAMDGWKLATTPALPNYKSEKGTYGGERILTRHKIAAATFEGCREHYLKRHNQQPLVGSTPPVLHAKSGHVVVASAYLRPGLRDQGANRPWPTSWNGTVLSDPECKAACDRDNGSVYDCAIVRADLATRLDIQAVYDVPWNTHCGIQITGSYAEWWAHKAVKEDHTPFIIPEAEWEKAADQVRNYPRFEGNRVSTKEGRGHVFHHHKQNAALQINSAYTQWVATLEIALLETHHVPADEMEVPGQS
ncbi:unnamed protein product, partial [Prorocentrum cordatum]